MQFLPDRIEHAANVVPKRLRDFVDHAVRQMVHKHAENGVRAVLWVEQPDIPDRPFTSARNTSGSEIGRLLRE